MAMTPLIPNRPCPYCASTSFARLKEAGVELRVAGVYDSSLDCPRFTLLMCLNCGWLASFVDPQAAVRYFGAHAERVDIAAQPPYR